MINLPRGVSPGETLGGRDIIKFLNPKVRACLGERDIVLHVPYLEMSDRDQTSSTFTEFHAGFDVVSSSIRH